ncbi:hypothetical protein FKP32DRAFT_1686515 [Trametes sanguinea]|nr:hypothetical protein FKP32DRAFT_1686515 [Trametes sanguinea]
MDRLHIYVAQYYNGVGPSGTRPYYWHVCIETGRDWQRNPLATAYTIKGCAASGFKPVAKEAIRFSTSNLFRGLVCVGVIDAPQYALAEQCIKGAVLYQQPGTTYDSQDWAEAAVRKLYSHGLIPTQWTKEVLQNELKEAEAAWENGDL